MRSGTVENLHDFKGKLDKIKELKIFKKIYAVTLDKCGNVKTPFQDIYIREKLVYNKHVFSKKGGHHEISTE